ncbi:MAG: C4-dicarboxylate ABC transporter permease, partial [Pikeienuella sp.]
DATVTALRAVQSLDLSALPAKMAKNFTKGFATGDVAIESLSAAYVAEEAVLAAADDYRPLLYAVRRLEKDIRKAEAEVKSLKSEISRNRGDEYAELRAEMEAEMAEHTAGIAELTAQIPAEWAEQYATFSKLTKAEQKARLTYRRSADASWETGVELMEILQSTPALVALEADLMALRATIESTDDPVASEATVKAFEKRFKGIDGADDVKKAITKARRAMKPKKPDPEKAMKSYLQAVEAYREQLAWRANAVRLETGVANYLDGIRGTLGARLQPKFTRDQALYMASCDAGHRDISLNF